MKEIKNESLQTGVTTAEMFTYALIVIVVSAVIFGKYFNYNLKKEVSEALALGESLKESIVEYYNTHGEMPQSGADAGLEEFIPAGVLENLTWLPGAFGESDSDPLRTGTLMGSVDLSAFGKRFVETESAFLLIARVQEDGSIIWDCMADTISNHSLPGRYLPDTCEKVSEPDEEPEDS